MKDLTEKFFLIFRYKILLTRSIYCISHSYAFFLFFYYYYYYYYYYYSYYYILYMYTSAHSTCFIIVT